MRAFLGLIAVLLTVGACNKVFGDDEVVVSAPGASTSARAGGVGEGETLPDGRRQSRCSSDDVVYDGEPTCHSGGEVVVVVTVIDGDTVELSDARRVRILGVDAPEADTCAGPAATAFTRTALIGNSRVVMHREPGVGQDQYGRELAYLQYAVESGSGRSEHWAPVASQDLGAELADAGLADVYEGGDANATYMATIRALVASSTDWHEGMWGPPCGKPKQTPAPVDPGHVDVDTDDDDRNLPDGALTGGYCARKWWC